MLVNRYRASRQRVAEARLFDLPCAFFDGYRIVLRHYALGLHREDPVQIASAAAPECCASFFCLHSESGIEFTDIAIPQKTIGGLHGGDSGQPQFLRKAPLPSPEASLR